MIYRNIWVHEQPPLLEDSSIVYKRKARWVKTNSGVGIFCGGDNAEYSVDSLLDIASSASHAFVSLLSELSDILFVHLKDLGIDFDQNTRKVKFTLSSCG